MTTTTTRPTTATDKILAAYNGENINTSLTAKALMDATGLSRTTVNTTLNKLAENGDVIRLDQDRVTTWSLTPSRKAALKRAAKKASTPKTRTLTKGQLKAMDPSKVGTLNLASGKVTMAAKASSTKGKNVTDDTTEANAEKPTRTATGRRTKGAIDLEITGYFQGNGNEPAGSYAIANAIGSSKGAAYVATKRMVNEGTLVLTSTEPDRYALPN